MYQYQSLFFKLHFPKQKVKRVALFTFFANIFNAGLIEDSSILVFASHIPSAKENNNTNTSQLLENSTAHL